MDIIFSLFGLLAFGGIVYLIGFGYGAKWQRTASRRAERDTEPMIRAVAEAYQIILDRL